MVIYREKIESALLGLAIAATAAGLGAETHVVFTMGALKWLLKEFKEKPKLEFDSKFLEKPAKEAAKRKEILDVYQLISMIKQFGGKIHACEFTLGVLKKKKEDLIEEVDDTVNLE